MVPSAFISSSALLTSGMYPLPFFAAKTETDFSFVSSTTFTPGSGFVAR